MQSRLEGVVPVLFKSSSRIAFASMVAGVLQCAALFNDLGMTDTLMTDVVEIEVPFSAPFTIWLPVMRETISQRGGHRKPCWLTG